MFLAAVSCITSPSAITVAAADRMSRARRLPTLDHHAEGLTEQEVADEHARLVAPLDAGGDPAAAHVALVHHVVVKEGRGVHEFDRGGELHRAVGLAVLGAVAAQVGAGQRQDRPQPLAARGDQVVGDLGDHRHVGAGARQDRRIHPLHPGRDEAHEIGEAGLRIGAAFIEGNDDAQARCLRKLSTGTLPEPLPRGCPLSHGAVGTATRGRAAWLRTGVDNVTSHTPRARMPGGG
jgi:hypothetical protein